MTNRRGFLGAMLAASMAPAIVRASSLMPIFVPKIIVPKFVLWGDGIRDDTLALQALIDGKEVIRHDGSTFTRTLTNAIFLSNGTYAISAPIIFKGDGHTMKNCHFKGTGNMQHALEFIKEELHEYDIITGRLK